MVKVLNEISFTLLSLKEQEKMVWMLTAYTYK
mgnify:CR=1 FL=1